MVEREGERGREREIARSLTTATETRGDASADAGAGRRRHLERRLSVAGGVDKERVARRPPCARRAPRCAQAAWVLDWRVHFVWRDSYWGKGAGGGGEREMCVPICTSARGGERPLREYLGAAPAGRSRQGARASAGSRRNVGCAPGPTRCLVTWQVGDARVSSCDAKSSSVHLPLTPVEGLCSAAQAGRGKGCLHGAAQATGRAPTWGGQRRKQRSRRRRERRRGASHPGASTAISPSAQLSVSGRWRGAPQWKNPLRRDFTRRTGPRELRREPLPGPEACRRRGAASRGAGAPGTCPSRA